MVAWSRQQSQQKQQHQQNYQERQQLNQYLGNDSPFLQAQVNQAQFLQAQVNQAQLPSEPAQTQRSLVMPRPLSADRNQTPEQRQQPTAPSASKPSVTGAGLKYAASPVTSSAFQRRRSQSFSHTPSSTTPARTVVVPTPAVGRPTLLAPAAHHGIPQHRTVNVPAITQQVLQRRL